MAISERSRKICQSGKLPLDSFTYGVLAVAIIVGGVAWFIAAYRADQRRP
jgi:hypothetical protein